ncbi:MAG TPA: hypothetical protein VE130_03675 [Nitrososphaeraceae archaeon]|nr:hypothetical protein [Nitrososphaeraceae archaeon]
MTSKSNDDPVRQSPTEEHDRARALYWTTDAEVDAADAAAIIE